MTLGLEITITDPAAELRQEIAAIRQSLPLPKGEGRGEALLPRLYRTIKNALSPYRSSLVSPIDNSLPPAPLSPCPPASLAIDNSQLTIDNSLPAAWLAREPLFLDVETTGLYKKDDPRVVEVAVIDSAGRVLFSTLVNPQKPIPPAATAANGISDADVADAPLWRDLAPHLKRILAGRFVVGHNIKFDSSFIPADWGIEWGCTKELANAILGKADWWEIKENPLRGGGLSARLYQLGLEPGPEHTAAGDCLSVLRLLRHLAGQTEPIGLIYQ